MSRGVGRDWLLATLAAGLLLSGCGPSTTPQASPTPAPVSSTPTPARTISDANLIKVSDLPEPSDGKIKVYAEHARPADQTSLCQHPLAELGATQTMSRSFKYVYGYSPRPTSRVPLANEPSTYTFALQFATPQAAEQARQTYKSWIDICRNGASRRGGFELVDRGFEWTKSPVSPGTAEVAEIAYRKAGSDSDYNYWESSGLTVVGDRMMLTVHLFYTNESLFGMHPEEDEEGYPHPQLGLTKAAAKRLAR